MLFWGKGGSHREGCRVSSFLSFSCSVAHSFPTIWDPTDCSTPGFSVLHHLQELAWTHVHWVSDAIQPSHPRPLLLPPSIFPSIRVFSSESALRIRWPKYWSFIISPSNEYSGLISFRIDWFDLLAVQGTLKSLLQHHSSVQFSCSIMSDSLRHHGLQHARPPCLSPTPGVYSNSYPLSRWCHPAISSSVVPFSCLQSFPAAGSFPMSHSSHQVVKVLKLYLQL